MEIRKRKVTNILSGKSWIVAGTGLLFAAPVLAQATGKLNDTGVTTCGNETSNSVVCGYADNDTYGFPGQDGEFGRSPKDAAGQLPAATPATGKTGASGATYKGFDFTRIANNNTTLNPVTLGTAATNWGCTKDNVTGLVWAMKQATASTTVTRPHLYHNMYTWHSTDSTSNGNVTGTSGVAASTSTSGTTAQCYSDAITDTCDTKSLMAHVNGQPAICGATANWRLPTRQELMSLVDLSKQGTGTSAVDPEYFPNLVNGNYWTANNVAGNPQEARVVNPFTGSDGTAKKSVKNYVILVRP